MQYIKTDVYDATKYLQPRFDAEINDDLKLYDVLYISCFSTFHVFWYHYFIISTRSVFVIMKRRIRSLTTHFSYLITRRSRSSSFLDVRSWNWGSTYIRQTCQHFAHLIFVLVEYFQNILTKVFESIIGTQTNLNKFYSIANLSKIGEPKGVCNICCK